jgi:dTDP-4-amino-4,6-dideoxygalactose transaminase
MPARSVPFFDYPFVFKQHADDFLAIFRHVGLRGAFILQQELAEFEQRLAAYSGAAFALGVGNATDGLLLALRAAGIRPGDEVIFCSHTMVATAAAIHFCDAVPVPVECGPDHLIDPAAVAAAVTPRTRAILPTQLNGRVCDMATLQTIAARHHLLIIEDAAQALGARFRGRQAGTFGLAAALSFYPAKTLGALGDAGALLTDDEQMAERLHLLRDHGRDASGEVISWGLNSRLDNLQAAILDYKLQRYDSEIAHRRTLAAHYQTLLGDVGELYLPPAPDSDSDHFDIYQNYEIEAERRDELRAALSSAGVGTLIQWGGKAVHQWPGLGFSVHLPFTEQMMARSLLLPLNRSLSPADVEYVAGTIRRFYGYPS